ncbi:MULTISPECIES: hypothetical protein [unclassified Streptomyces]|uniref:hypothetical protein n=1 Tax=unclassified Streptomyces TaxID=2593676 RepID=UPI00386E9EA6
MRPPGRAIAREFARRGDRVGLVARGLTGLNAAADELRVLGAEAPVVPADTADPAAVHAAAEHAESLLGQQTTHGASRGASTVGTVLADKIAAGLLDRYLAHTGCDSQQTDEPVPVHRPDNLWRPLDGEGEAARDYGAPGVFDDRAHGRSAQAWLSRHAGPAWIAAALTAVGVALRARRNRRS